MHEEFAIEILIPLVSGTGPVEVKYIPAENPKYQCDLSNWQNEF